MLVPKRKKFEDCNHQDRSDFSFYQDFGRPDKTPHFYCPDCKAHWFHDKVFNAEEWRNYIDKGE
jgi:hypothetical protein